MQRSYVSSDKYLPIPGSGGRYTANLEGQVRCVGKGPIPTTLDNEGNRVVRLELWNGMADYQLALIMAFVFKPQYLPEHHWPKLSVGFINGDKTNCHPGNLVWHFPEGGIECDHMPGFNYIPGFTRYVIDRRGKLYHLTKSIWRTPFKSHDVGYMAYRHLRPDLVNKKYVTGRHRLVALAWKTYPSNVDSLDVNHLDSIPGNDSDDNLEWATRKENINHAKRKGRLAKSRPVLTRCVLTNTVTHHFSILDCANNIGVRAQAVVHRLNQLNQPVFSGYLQFKFEKDETPWREVVDPAGELRGSAKHVGLTVEELSTGKILTFSNIVEAVKELGVNALSIRKRLNNERFKDIPIKGYIFRKQV